ncbi:MAG: carbon monoxide dehydrogenase subunit G [Rhodospirillales bacterium]|nr:carbon monoxide dehydrogenase subunit G [Rhodospirillales bacterium]
MKMNGEFRVPTDRETVWQALNDPEVLKACLPGCQEIEKTSDTEMTATLALKVGPVKATFAGGVTLSDLDPPNSYTLSGQGQGGAAGFASGEARVRLEEEDGGTVVHYDVDAKVGGKLAQIGSRLIDSTAKKLSKQFFDSLAEKLGGGEEAEAAAEPSQEAATATPAETVPPPEPAPASPETAASPAEAPAESAPGESTAAESEPPPLAPAKQRMELPTAAWVGGVVVVVVVLILVFAGVI